MMGESPGSGVERSGSSSCARGFHLERMMGLEPTTFCMAKGSGGLTIPDATHGIRIVERNHSRGVVHRQAVSGHRT
jgi:hypothetical protein